MQKIGCHTKTLPYSYQRIKAKINHIINISNINNNIYNHLISNTQKHKCNTFSRNNYHQV